MADSEIRVGRVSSINYEAGMARVTYRDKDETVTSEFSLTTNNEEYKMPEIGQDVLVAHLSNGSSRGVIVGTLWNKKNIPRESGKGLYRKDLSREKDAAYIRYSDETGEYLLKVANLHLNGVNKTTLDGPEVEIAANISILLQSEQINLDVEELIVTGGEVGAVNANVKADVNIIQEENPLKCIILKAAVELLESLNIKTGTDIGLEAEGKMECSATSAMKIHGGESAEISTGGSLRLSDGNYSVTLAEIMERLEALGG